MRSRLAFVLPLAFTLAAAPTTAPQSIAVPDGHQLVATLHATGVQVYVAVTTTTGLGWKLLGPLATLTDPTGVEAYHYDGPTWEDADGSRIARDPAVPVRSTPAPHDTADIPWLLVKAKPDGDTPGKFATVDYVQRADTAGGVAPAAPPIRLGTKVAVPYTATYRFYAPTR